MASDNKLTGLVHIMPSPVGRPSRFKTPKELWDKFVEYCDWVDGNPWQEKTASNVLDQTGTGEDQKQKNALRQNVVVTQRAYTLYGFCAFAGIHYKWGDFRKNYIDKQGFQQVIDQIENIICAQQVDGAMINKFNGSLVARLNGFADKQWMELTGRGGEDFKWPKLSEADLKYLKDVNGL